MEKSPSARLPGLLFQNVIDNFAVILIAVIFRCIFNDSFDHQFAGLVETVELQQTTQVGLGDILALLSIAIGIADERIFMLYTGSR